MALSDHEQKLLDEMERNLFESESDQVVAQHRGHSPAFMVGGILLIVVGVVGLLIGVGSKLIIIGVLGFALMVGGVVLISLPRRSAARGSTQRQEAASASKPEPSSSTSFSDKMRERWERDD